MQQYLLTNLKSWGMPLFLVNCSHHLSLYFPRLTCLSQFTVTVVFHYCMGWPLYQHSNNSLILSNHCYQLLWIKLSERNIQQTHSVQLVIINDCLLATSNCFSSASFCCNQPQTTPSWSPSTGRNLSNTE